MSKHMGADVVLDPKQCDVVAELRKLTGGGADVAIEALGLQETFENSLRCLRPGGTLSSLGVYSGKLQVPYDAFAAGIGDYKIVTTLCPGGKERMRRLMSMVQSKRFDPTPLLTHSFQARSNCRGVRSFWFAPRRLPESGDQALTEANDYDESRNFRKRTKAAPSLHQIVPRNRDRRCADSRWQDSIVRRNVSRTHAQRRRSARWICLYRCRLLAFKRGEDGLPNHASHSQNRKTELNL